MSTGERRWRKRWVCNLLLLLLLLEPDRDLLLERDLTRRDGLKECCYEIEVEQLGVKVDHLLLERDLESLLLLLLLDLLLDLDLDLLLPLDRLLLASLSSPPSPFFPRRSLRGTGGLGGFTTTLTELAICLAGGES